MKRLKIELLFNNIHFIFIFIILLIVCINNWYFIPLLTLYSIFLIKKTKIFKICLIVSGLILISYLQYFFTSEDVSSVKGIVVECDSKKAVISSNFKKIMIYHNKEVSLGDYGIFSLKEVNYDTELFSYSDYLMNKNIVSVCKVEEFTYVDNFFVIGKIKDYFVSKVDTYPSIYKSYIKTLIFADKDIEEDIKEKTSNLGISHLLAVSGMHVSILILIVEFILKRIFYFENYIDIGICIFIIFYLIITNFELTVFRAGLMVLFAKLFKHKKLFFTSLDVLSIVGILILIIHPRYLNLLSFQLSFLVSFVIIISAGDIKEKSKVKSVFYISFIAFITTLPLIVKTNYTVNLLSVIVGPIYVLFFEILLYPITLIMLVIPKSYIILDIFYNVFETSLSILDEIKITNIVFGSLSTLEIFVYYVILYFLLISFKSKRGRVYLTAIYILFMCFIYSKPYLNPFYVVSVYDVGQGDTILITLPHSKKNILIDCYNNALDHLKKDGIKNIDVIILTHGHSDHINVYEEIVDFYNVKTTYSSLYDDTSLLKELKKEYDIKLLSSDDIIFVDELKLNILGPIRKYENENDNSLVIQTIIEERVYLFTADIEQAAELDLIAKYKDILKSDVVKVAHHGSNSSFSKEFLNYVKGDYYLISVKQNNKYGFPNNTNVLDKPNVYRTDEISTFKIYSRKKSFYIRKKLLLW